MLAHRRVRKFDPDRRVFFMQLAPSTRIMAPDLQSLDGIRGLCSVIIVLGHIFVYWTPAWPGDAAAAHEKYPVFGIEYLSPVTLFFVMTRHIRLRIGSGKQLRVLPLLPRTA
jgi:hypothetical protein